MQLVSYGPFGSERAGILVANKIIDLSDGMKAAGCTYPVSDMRMFLEQEDWLHSAKRVNELASELTLVDLTSVRLGAPVPLPRKLLIAGANTKSHIAEAESVLITPIAPKEPMILAKATSSICGPFDDVVHPRETNKLDYEVELAVIIGRKCRRIEEAEVKNHVAGFTVTNEISARDVQLAEHEDNPFFRVHFMGKSFDTFSPMGPALVTSDEFDWNQPLPLRTTVNGEIRQDDDTDDLYYGIERLISYISQVMTLFPGDIISTGSPAGVANFMKPPRFLKPGDVVRCEIGGVGAIENRIVSG